MNTKFLALTFFFTSVIASPAPVRAAGPDGGAPVELSYDIIEPSMTLAKRFQKQGDYVTAMLLYEEVLKDNPSNKQALKRMVECHEALAKKDAAEKSKVIPQAKPTSDDALSDLPNLIPADNTNAQQPAQSANNHIL